MATKRKKRKEPEKEFYEFEIEDWVTDFCFGANLSDKINFPGDYFEHSTLSLSGKIISPEIKNATKVRVRIFESPELENHWDNNQESSPESIGYITLLKEIDLLEIFFPAPPRYFKNILISISAGKIKFCHVYGTKIKWGRGIAHNIRFSTEKEEE
jgi:hypothetical protein